MVSGVICVDACDELYNPTLKTAGALEIGDVKKKIRVSKGDRGREGDLVSSGAAKMAAFRRLLFFCPLPLFLPRRCLPPPAYKKPAVHETDKLLTHFF